MATGYRDNKWTEKFLILVEVPVGAQTEKKKPASFAFCCGICSMTECFNGGDSHFRIKANLLCSERELGKAWARARAHVANAHPDALEAACVC